MNWKYFRCLIWPMKKLLASLIIFLWSFITLTNAIVVEVPDPSGTNDIAVVWATQISGDESSLFATIQMVNKYLWMALWLVCMVLLVYSGIGLITANWDEKKMKTANKVLTGSLIWIIISIFSFSVVRLVINLFNN